MAQKDGDAPSIDCGFCNRLGGIWLHHVCPLPSKAFDALCCDVYDSFDCVLPTGLKQHDIRHGRSSDPLAVEECVFRDLEELQCIEGIEVREMS